ncbi:DUF4347 domain-containing protein [Labrenzia sp. PHM005]|uniref:DUF4347 domain-containing protein n=1 Tax=Labrenzia sp. PHM005 TaxID=2590016 RepID=UPI00113FF0E1|nr:DUF4347 domain-containing protein [Labrenzia sp. PHM005]QDG77283.1 DUF4347 domain-containing protein [Labrenzia sp. PHM005]
MSSCCSNILYVSDASVSNLELLQRNVPVNAEMIVLSNDADGILELANRVVGRTGIEALHIVSHGRDGGLILGNAVLSNETLVSYQAALLTLNRALSETADILLYGCEVAKTEKGAAFVVALAEATGANVAASRTLTGAAYLGGDWELDVHVGQINAASLQCEEFRGVLGADPLLPAGLSGSPFTYGGVTFSEKIDGELTVTDGRSALKSGGNADRYEITGVADGTTLYVYMGNSLEVDDYIQIGRPTGPGTAEIAAFNDDDGDGTSSYDAYLSWTYQTGDQILTYPYNVAGSLGTYSLFLSQGTLNEIAPPSFSSAPGQIASYVDTVGSDTFTASNTTLTSATANAVYSVDASNGNSTTSRLGNYGTLNVAADGSVTYSPDDAKINALSEGQSVTDTFTVNVSDGIMKGSETLTISITGANDRPTLTAFAATVDSGQKNEEIEISFAELASQGNEQDVDGSVNAFIVQAVSSGTLKIGTSSATATAWEAGVNDVVDATNKAYWTSAADQSGTLDAFTVVVRDNGNAASLTAVKVTVAVNAAPEFGNLDGDAPSGTLNTAIAFDAGGDATVTDPDGADLNSGTLTITRTGTLEGNFALNDANATSDGDGTIAAGQTIAVGGTNIGTVTTDGQGSNNLVITFNSADATPARIQTLIQALTYQSSETGTHGFTITLSDGDGGTSANTTVTLSVAAPSTGGGGTNPVTVVTEEDNSGATPETKTTVTTNGSGSGSAAIVENTNNNGNVVTATLPASTTLTVTGPNSAQSGADAVTSLVKAVDNRDSTAESELITGAQTFLNTLAQTTTLDVRTVVPTTSQTSLSDPITITGTSATGGSTQSEAFVIDTRSLPNGAQLQLNNIEFATIVGEATVTGGSGQNYVVGDDNRQVIILGAEDDQLFGGGGDDTVGSEGGNDLIHGGVGNDLLFGGAGNDMLDGGGNRDAALYGGTSSSVSLSGTRSSVTAVDGQGTDTLTGVELVVFAGTNASGKDRVTVLAQDSSTVTGQYGFNEAAYLAANPDVAAAVSAGTFASGAEHYATYGKGEGRVADLVFDAEFYLADNADVAAAVAAGAFASASEHYELNGYKENRSVNPLFDADYYLAQNTDVAEAVAAGGFNNAYQHFVLCGDSEGRAASAFFDTATYRVERRLADDASALEHFLLIGLPQGITAPTAADFTAHGVA